MALKHLSRYAEEARMNEDLCLDSVLVLELLVHLELQFGLTLPDDAPLPAQLGTVGSFAEFLLERASPRRTPATGDTAP